MSNDLSPEDLAKFADIKLRDDNPPPRMSGEPQNICAMIAEQDRHWLVKHCESQARRIAELEREQDANAQRYSEQLDDLQRELTNAKGAAALHRKQAERLMELREQCIEKHSPETSQDLLLLADSIEASKTNGYALIDSGQIVRALRSAARPQPETGDSEARDLAKALREIDDAYEFPVQWRGVCERAAELFEQQPVPPSTVKESLWVHCAVKGCNELSAFGGVCASHAMQRKHVPEPTTSLTPESICEKCGKRMGAHSAEPGRWLECPLEPTTVHQSGESK